MLNKKTGKQLLAVVLALALCAASVFAAEPSEQEGAAGQAEADQILASNETDQPEDGQEDQDVEESGDGEEEYVPDPAGTVSYENLERRMRANNLSLLALEESIQAIEAIDYDEMADDYRDGLNDIAKMQWGMLTNPMLGGMGSIMSSSLDAQYDALREAFDAIKDGDLQQDNADLIRQLENTQNQLVVAGEALYIALAGLEINQRTLDRTLDATDRSIQEVELRYQLGQVSALTQEQAQAGRTALLSSQQTLRMNQENLSIQLKQMIGADLTSELELTALPEVTGEELEAMNLEEDLEAAKTASYSLYDAKLTLDDAKETFDDAPKNQRSYEYQVALHQWQSAQHTYNAAVQSFETNFRILFNQVKDCKQLLDAARTALAVEESNYAVDQLKYEQGTISYNELLTAQDDLAAAQDEVDTAAINLFSTYNTYRWAVDYGILN